MQDPHDLDGLSGEHAISPELSAMTAEQVAGTVLARAGQTGPRKRRKGPDGQHIPAEPRRLRRSHEACARCRSKKIKVSAAVKSSVFPVGVARRQCPFHPSHFIRMLFSMNIAHIPLVRLQTSQMYRLRLRWRCLPPGRPLSPTAYPSGPHRTT
jgi:hypothetical protein